MNHKILASLLAAACMSAQADTVLGVFVGAQAWQSDLSGDATAITKSKVDGDGSNTIIYAALEHPLPLVPNVRLAQASIKQDIDPTGEADLSYTDLTLYYEILDNWVSLDIGVNARKNSGHFTGTPPTIDEDIDSTLAMLYGKAQFELPLSGLGLGLEVATGAGSDDKATDANAYLIYETSIGLGVIGGYRVLDTDIETKNIKANLKVDGAYASVYYHF